MSVYLVSYDLIGPNRDYDKVAKPLASYPDHSRPLESVWLIKTVKKAAEIRDELKKYIDANDKAIVLKVDPSTWATRNVGNAGEWIRKNL